MEELCRNYAIPMAILDGDMSVLISQKCTVAPFTIATRIGFQPGLIKAFYVNASVIMTHLHTRNLLYHYMHRVSKMAFDCELGLRPSRQDILRSLINKEEVQNTISIPVSQCPL